MGLELDPASVEVQERIALTWATTECFGSSSGYCQSLWMRCNILTAGCYLTRFWMALGWGCKVCTEAILVVRDV